MQVRWDETLSWVTSCVSETRGYLSLHFLRRSQQTLISHGKYPQFDSEGEVGGLLKSQIIFNYQHMWWDVFWSIWSFSFIYLYFLFWIWLCFLSWLPGQSPIWGWHHSSNGFALAFASFIREDKAINSVSSDLAHWATKNNQCWNVFGNPTVKAALRCSKMISSCPG